MSTFVLILALLVCLLVLVWLVQHSQASLVAIPTIILLHICKDHYLPFDLAFS